MRVELPTQPQEAAELWNELLDLSEQAPAPWILIGAQMVTLHALRAGAEPSRTSRDGDVLVNVRKSPKGTELLARHLDERGFELVGPDRMGQGHEFQRGGVSIDILAPDNLGQRANLGTLRQARTVSVPGGTQALARSEVVCVRIGRREGAIRVPDLHGAIVLKLEAIAVDDVPEAQKQDVALLLTLVGDSAEMKANLTPRERKLFARYPDLGDPTSAPYRGLVRAREAATKYRQLADG